MTENKFCSVFSNEQNSFIEHRRNCNFKDVNIIYNLRNLDVFIAESCTDKCFTVNILSIPICATNYQVLSLDLTR